MTVGPPPVETVGRTATSILVANVVGAASWWLVFLAIARLESFDAAGQFAIIMAVATPTFSLFVSGARPARLSDPPARLDSSEDWTARVIGGAFAVVVCAVCFVVGLAGGAAVAMGAVAARYVDAVAEAPYTYYQKERRNRPLLTSSSLRALVLVVAVVVALVVSDGSTGEGLLIGATLSLGILVAFDVPRALKRSTTPGVLRRAFGIVRSGVPLGVAAVLFSLTLNISRIVLGSSRGDGAAGRFAAMTMLFAVVSLVTTAASYTAIPVLARARQAGGRSAFGRVMRKMLLLGAALGVTVVGFAATVGTSVLGFVFGTSFSGERDPFILMAIALAILCIATLMQDGLTALGIHRSQVLIFGVGALVALVCSIALIPPHGIGGAAVAVFVASGVQCVVCGVVLLVGIRRAFPPTSRSASAISLSA